MSEFRFDSELEQKPNSFKHTPPARGMSGWLIKHSFGVVKNSNQANTLLLAFALVSAVILFIVWSNEEDTSSRADFYQEIPNYNENQR